MTSERLHLWLMLIACIIWIVWMLASAGGLGGWLTSRP